MAKAGEGLRKVDRSDLSAIDPEVMRAHVFRVCGRQHLVAVCLESWVPVFALFVDHGASTDAPPRVVIRQLTSYGWPSDEEAGGRGRAGRE